MESVRRLESEGTGKSDEVSVMTGEVSEIQMLLEKYYNVYEDRIGLEKCLPKQQDKCRGRHVQAAINAPKSPLEYTGHPTKIGNRAISRVVKVSTRGSEGRRFDTRLQQLSD